jgi:hypothetical protein
MLGHHPRLEHELRKKGRRAFAKVLECRRTHYTETVGGAAVADDRRILWSLVLQVEPDGEAPFEARIDALLPELWSPEPSTELAFPVLYDPADHSKVVLDQSDEGYRELGEAQSEERIAAEARRMRSRGQGVWADRYEAAMDSLVEYGRNDDPSTSPDLQAQRWEDEKAKMKAIVAGDTEAALTEEELQTREKHLRGQ